ncbi:MAG: hypothetical protein ABSA59_04680 [Terriglobia bacterium]|jgi:hypothetical protein
MFRLSTLTLLCFLTLAGMMAVMRGQEAPQDSRLLPSSYWRGEPLRIGNQVQLLADDYIVEDRWKLTREVGKVLKSLRNPVIVRDQPWEGAVGGSPCVLYDAKLRKFRMWYQVFNLTNYFSREGPSYYVGYAESDDGINWTKPRLEGFPFGGYDRTNIVMTGRGGKRASGLQVLLNPDPSDPQRRFLGVYVGGGVDLAYSPDGLHWTVAAKPLFPYHSDFPNHLLWIPEWSLWYLYVRPSLRPNGVDPLPEGLRHTGRRLALSTSKDLENWTMPRTVLYPDERDEPDYDSAFVFRRYGLFLALYAMMHMEHGNSEAETYLAVSRDGIHWERTWDRQPLIPRGPEGSYDHGQIEPGHSPPVELGDDLLFYYYASPYGQKEWDSETSVAVCRLRKDRFIGQWAGDQTAYLLTRQFILQGSKLQLNCSALPGPYLQDSDGIKVEIIAAPDFKTKDTLWETTIPGFTFADCDRIITDDPAHTVTWHGKSDLSALKGQAVYLRFQMKKAALFAFQVAP